MLPGGARGAWMDSKRGRDKDRGRESERERDAARRGRSDEREREKLSRIGLNSRRNLSNSSASESEQHRSSPLPPSRSPCSDLQHPKTSSSSDRGKWSNAPRRIRIWYSSFSKLRASIRRTTTIFEFGGLRSSILRRSDDQTTPDQSPATARAASASGSIYSREYRRRFDKRYTSR